MRVTFGFKAHSGWAALVTLGQTNGDPVVVDRQRVDLAGEAWAKQPYHAAEGLKPAVARDLVKRAIESVHRRAVRELRTAIKRETSRKNEVSGCAVIVGEPMPDWTVEEILAVHFRMHKAEGVLFRDALARAATSCGVTLVQIPEKQLTTHAEKALKTPAATLAAKIAMLGKSVGPPWGKDQKEAALAALVALQGSVRRA